MYTLPMMGKYTVDSMWMAWSCHETTCRIKNNKNNNDLHVNTSQLINEANNMMNHGYVNFWTE